MNKHDEKKLHVIYVHVYQTQDDLLDQEETYPNFKSIIFKMFVQCSSLFF